MRADAERLDAKFRAKPPLLGPPERFVIDAAAGLERGTLLDLACGDGANAVELAAMGFRVTAADISEVGLERLRGFARQRGLEIATLRIDLDDRVELAGLAPHEMVVVSRFKPGEILRGEFPRLVLPGGRLVLATFNQRHSAEHGFRAEYCLAPGEPQAWFQGSGLELLRVESIEAPGRFLDGYVFRKVGLRASS